MVALTEQHGLKLVSGGTHPFADWREQDIYPDERYLQVVEDMQLVARSNLIFGLHVHIGIEDREIAIHLMNQVRYFLPHLLALSANSPFWIGLKTGLKSYRCKVFDKFPRTNIPDTFIEEVADHAMMLLLATHRRAIEQVFHQHHICPGAGGNGCRDVEGHTGRRPNGRGGRSAGWRRDVIRRRCTGRGSPRSTAPRTTGARWHAAPRRS